MNRRSTLILVAILTAVILAVGYLVFLSTIPQSLGLGEVVNRLREIEAAKGDCLTENNITKEGTPMSETNVFPYMTLRGFVACFSNATNIQYRVNPSAGPPEARLLHRFVVRDSWMTFKIYPKGTTIRFTNDEVVTTYPTK
jgi:hypothetical protein